MGTKQDVEQKIELLTKELQKVSEDRDSIKRLYWKQKALSHRLASFLPDDQLMVFLQKEDHRVTRQVARIVKCDLGGRDESQH